MEEVSLSKYKIREGTKMSHFIKSNKIRQDQNQTRVKDLIWDVMSLKNYQ